MRWFANLLVMILLVPGCVERTITITSEPNGALVHLNDEEVGRTPLTVPFTWYGVYDVRLEKKGYQPLWTTGAAKAPLWETPGPDLVAEALPNVKSHINWHFIMEEVIDPIEFDRAALVERADDLRSRTWLPNQLLRRRDDPQTHPSGLPAPPREPTKPSNQ